jgi:2-iminoacetate synthase
MNATLELQAQQASKLTQQYFGKTIGLYAPLYLANYCDNVCTYCGFQQHQDIPRLKLSPEQIETECQAIAATGIQSILLLTGESRVHTPVAYIEAAVRIARRFFPHVVLEIYPVDTEEYRKLYEAGADGVTVYQETYDRDRYDQLHKAGRKKNYDYRYQAPFRIAEAGFRQISIGALLGLWDWHKEIPELFAHLDQLLKQYPGVEYSLSFPRIRILDCETTYYPVSDTDLVEIICQARLRFPRVGINVSTRENANMRDHLIGLGVTKISAGSLTTVGGYGSTASTSLSTSPLTTSALTAAVGQFEVNAERSVAEIKKMISAKGYDPVFTDWRAIANG